MKVYLGSALVHRQPVVPKKATISSQLTAFEDGSIFSHALAQHLREGAEAYVANHHNPKRCQATLGFVRTANSLGIQLERLEDSSGFALGSLKAECPFQDGRFQALEGTADAPWLKQFPKRCFLCCAATIETT